MKKTLLSLSLLVLLAIMAVVGLRLLSEEDTWLCQNGEWVRHGNPASPQPTSGCSRSAAISGINVVEPARESTLGEMFLVSGETANLKDDLFIRLRDATGTEIFKQPVATQATAAGNRAAFAGQIDLREQPQLDSGDYTIDVFHYNSQGGQETGLVSVPVKIVLSQPAPKITVKVYFGNNRLDPEMTCQKVFPVERSIPKTIAVGRAVLEELFRGPTAEEKALGFFTSLNEGVRLNSLAVASGTAVADFSAELDRNIGGSCRVSAISAQIRATLKQLPTVGEVIISRNGDSEAVLQP